MSRYNHPGAAYGLPVSTDMADAVKKLAAHSHVGNLLTLIAAVLDDGLADSATYLTLGHNKAGMHLITIWGGGEPIRISGSSLAELDTAIADVLVSP